MSYHYKKSSILYELQQAIKKKVAEKPKPRQQAQKNIQSSLDRRKSQNQRQSVQRLPSRQKQLMKTQKPEISAATSLFNNENLINMPSQQSAQIGLDSKKTSNRKIDKLFSLINYVLSSAQKAMKYINLQNFEAEFAVKLFKSDRQNLVNQIRNFNIEEILEGLSHREEKTKMLSSPNMIILQEENLKLRKQIVLLEKQNERSRFGITPNDLDIVLLMKDLQIQKYKQSIYRLKGPEFINKLTAIIDKEIKYENLLRKNEGAHSEFDSIFRTLISERNNLCKIYPDSESYRNNSPEWEEVRHIIENKIGGVNKKQQSHLKALQKYIAQNERQGQRGSSKKIHSEQQIAAEQQKIAKIRQEKQELVVEIEECKRKLGETIEILSMKSQLQHATKQIKKAEAKLKYLCSDVTSNEAINLSFLCKQVQQKFNSLTISCNQLQLKNTQFEELEQRSRQLQRQVYLYKDQGQMLQAQLKAKNEQIRDLDKIRINLIQQSESKTRQICRIEAQLESEIKRIRQRESQVDALKQEIKILQEQKQQVQSFSGSLSALEAENGALQIQNQKLKRHVEQLKQIIDELETQIATNQQQLSQKIRQAEDRSSQSFSDALSRQKLQYNQLEARTRQEKIYFQELLKTYNDERESSKKKIQNLNVFLATALDEKAKLEQQIERLNVKQKSENSEGNQAKLRLQEAIQRVAEVQKQNEEQKQNIEALADAKSILQSKCSEIQKRVSQAEIEIEARNMQIADLKYKQEQDYADKQNIIRELQHKMTNQQLQDIAKYQRLYEQLHLEIRKKQQQIAQLESELRKMAANQEDRKQTSSTQDIQQLKLKLSQFETLNAQLNLRVISLEAEQKQFDADTEAKIDQLNSQLTQVQQKSLTTVESKQLLIKALKTELEHHQTDYASRQQSIRQQLADIASRQAELGSLSSELVAKAEGLKQAQTKLQLKETELQQQQRSLQEREKEVESRQKLFQYRWAQIQNTEEKMVALEDKYQKIISGLKFQLEQTTLQSQNHVRQVGEQFEAKIAQISQEKSNIAAELTSKQQLITQISELKNEMQLQIRTKASLIQQLEASTLVREKEILGLKSQIASQDQKYSTKIREQTQTITQLQNKVASLTFELESSKKIQNDALEQEQQVNKLLQHIQVMEHKIQEYEAREEEKLAQQEYNTQCLQELESELISLKTEHSQIKEKYALTVGKLEETINELGAVIEEKQKKEKQICDFMEVNKALSQWKTVQTMLQKQYCNLIKRILRASIDLQQLGDIDTMSVRTLLEVGAQKVMEQRIRARQEESNEKKTRQQHLEQEQLQQSLRQGEILLNSYNHEDILVGEISELEVSLKLNDQESLSKEQVAAPDEVYHERNIHSQAKEAEIPPEFEKKQIEQNTSQIKNEPLSNTQKSFEMQEKLKQDEQPLNDIQTGQAVQQIEDLDDFNDFRSEKMNESMMSNSQLPGLQSEDKKEGQEHQEIQVPEAEPKKDINQGASGADFDEFRDNYSQMQSSLISQKQADLRQNIPSPSAVKETADPPLPDIQGIGMDLSHIDHNHNNHNNSLELDNFLDFQNQDALDQSMMSETADKPAAIQGNKHQAQHKQNAEDNDFDDFGDFKSERMNESMMSQTETQEKQQVKQEQARIVKQGQDNEFDDFNDFKSEKMSQSMLSEKQEKAQVQQNQDEKADFDMFNDMDQQKMNDSLVSDPGNI